MTTDEWLDVQALRHPCPYCEAGVGSWCRHPVSGGTPTLYLHGDRVQPVREAYGKGWGEGYVLGARDYARRQAVQQRTAQVVAQDAVLGWDE